MTSPISREVAPAILTMVLTIALCFLLPLSAAAQQVAKVPRVGLLGTATPSLMAPWITAFRDGLRKHGYVEGQNVVIEYRWGEGKPERFPGLVAELVALKVDVIVTSGPHAIRAAQRATSTIPIVMAIVEDPVEQGFVTSFGRPGGNLTGLSFQDPDLATKRVQLLHEAIPSVSRVAALWDSSSAGPTAMKATERAASSVGLVLHVLEVRAAVDLDRAFQAARQRRDQAVIQLASPLFAAHRKTIVALMAKNRLPAVCQERTFVVDGCLMAYGPNFPDMFRRAADYVDRILKGAKPAELPVEQASTFELVINLQTAKALGVTLSPSVLARADHIVE